MRSPRFLPGWRSRPRRRLIEPAAPSDIDTDQVSDEVSQASASDRDEPASEDSSGESGTESTSAIVSQVVAPEKAEVPVDDARLSRDSADGDVPVEEAENEWAAADSQAPIVSQPQSSGDETAVELSGDESGDRKATADGDAPVSNKSSTNDPSPDDPSPNDSQAESLQTTSDPSSEAVPTSEVAGTTLAAESNESSRRDRRRGRGSNDDVASTGNAANSNETSQTHRSRVEATSSTGFAIPTEDVAVSQVTEAMTPEVQQKVDATLNATAAMAAKTQTAAATSAARANVSGESVGQSRSPSSMTMDPTVGSRADTTARMDKPKQADGSSETQQADLLTRIKLVQRVSKAFQHLGPDGGVIRLRLAPAEMGTVRVEMRMQQKKIEARVVADTEAAGAALREHLPDLRSRLEAFGMQVDKIEVDIEPFQMNDERGSQPQNGFGDASSPRQRPDRAAMSGATQRNRGVSQTAASVAASGPVWVRTASGGVDVRI